MRSIAATVAFALLAGGVAVRMSLFFSEEEVQQRIIDAQSSVVEFRHAVDSFLIEQANLLIGFSAFLNTFDSPSEGTIYRFLGELLAGNLGYIRNVSVVRDTTIAWVFPREGNEAAIGVDLAKVPTQAASVLEVKEGHKRRLQGPVDLVQGGRGYVLRLPLLKGGSYWGMVSIVLRADAVEGFLVDAASRAGLAVFLTAKGDASRAIAGDPGVLGKRPLRSSMGPELIDWDFYGVPSRGWEAGRAASPFGLALIALLFALIFLFFLATKRVVAVIERNKVLKKRAETDKLTGIHNRAMLESYLEAETDRADRFEYPMSMIFFDLDRFKDVNDTMGHEAGDRVLAGTARTVVAMLRKGDVFVRWGGEEFIVVMPQTELRGAVQVAEKLRAAMAEAARTRPGFVTVSLGVAERAPREFAGSWIWRADKALYVAKREGRDRISVSEHYGAASEAQVRVLWREEWDSGHALIDEEHRALVAAGNELAELSWSEDEEAFLGKLEETILIATSHFADEVAVLSAVGYPFAAAHEALHEELARRAFALRDDIRAGRLLRTDAYGFLFDSIIVEHMVKEDTKFFSYVGRAREGA